MKETGYIRKAEEKDIDAVAAIYAHIHEQERAGKVTIGWLPGIYPVRGTAEAALARGDLFVYEEEGRVLAAAVINQTQVDAYADGKWTYPARDDEVMVLHTLVVEPTAGGRGIGRAFVAFYERYAREHGCTVLRMDTNAKNAAARRLYQKLGYGEPDIVPCTFNGIPGVQLVLLEKKLD